MAALTHDERLKDRDEVYLQFALLYTTTDGHRRIRWAAEYHRACVRKMKLLWSTTA